MQYNFCPKCGNKVPANSAFCPTCGYRLIDNADNQTQQEQAQPQFQNMNINDNYNVNAQTVHQPLNRSFADTGVNGFLKQMYGWLFMSLLIAGVCAYIGSSFAILMNPWVMIGLCILGYIPMIMTYKNAMVNPSKAIGSLIVFAVIDGFSLSSIFVIYTGQNLAAAFISSSAIFGIMSLIGITTHRDLAKLGTQLFGATIALLVAMIINIFLRSPAIAMFLSLGGVVIFSGLSIYDTHTAIKLYNHYRDNDTTTAKGIAIMGALSLYIDFENLFIFILDIISDFTNNN